MSNKQQLQTNNTALDRYIARINAAKDVAASLPDAGSGGGNIETCTVTLTATTGIIRYGATKYVDGILTCENSVGSGAVNLTLNNVVKGSCLTVTCHGLTANNCSASNCTVEEVAVADMDRVITIFFKVND